MNDINTFSSKYKPYNLNETFLKKELHNILNTLFDLDDLNLLFVGPSNSGKTTILDCIIRKYYNIDKKKSISNNNTMFINNLKEQGVNYYRNEMKTFCQSHSSIFNKKKLVVIDDMDTLSEQSQQVFRNYIDKYKNNVNFICVCSNVQKILESIQSRLYIFKIEPITINENNEIMQKIIKNENINIQTQAKDYLLSICNNNVRNVINNLEKINIFKKEYELIDLNTCKKLCANISIQQFEIYIDTIKDDNINDAIQILYKFHDYGYSVIDILEFFFYFIKITNSICENKKYKCIKIICEYITIFHRLHEDIIELAIFTYDIFDIIKNN